MNSEKINGLKELQNITLGDVDIKIAVLDGQVDLTHPCFNVHNNQLVSIESNALEPSSIDNLALKHGTAVTSLIFGKHDSGVDGVSPACSSLIIPIYAQDKNGKFLSATQVKLANAITLAVEKGANIINISGGQLSKSSEPEVFLKKAIEACQKAGVLIVAAAGNDGCNCIHVPASDQKVLAVGSIDENGEPTNMTNYGDPYLSNGILAPGKNLKAAQPNGGFFLTGDGTSYATPIVTGVIALLMSLQKKLGLTPDPYEIKKILENTATPCNPNSKKACKRFLKGTLNINAAIKMITHDSTIKASGSDSSNIENFNIMKNISELNNENNLNSSIEKINLLPSEGIATPVSSFTNEGSVVKELASMAIDPSCGCDQKEKEKKDDDDIEQTKTNVKPSSENIPLLNINNQTKEKMEKMENKTAFENTAPSVSENVLSPSGEIDPSCGCDGNTEKPATVYALGTIDYDFGSESHRDSFIQTMGGANPHDPAALLNYLSKNPWDAEELIWTLNIDSTPIYSIIPNGSHAAVGYEKLREILENQKNGNIQRISVPGLATGSRTLLNGSQVTNLFPRLRGMYSWTTEALVSASASGTKGSSKALAENVTSFLNRIYYKMRNLGVSSEDRALNYAATNAFQVSQVFAQALKENLELNDISASKSPICRPGADCYDVVLSFFNPKERLTQARKEFRFTIDVSDIVPVTIGEVRSWSVY